MNYNINVSFFLRHPVFNYADTYLTRPGGQREISTCTIMDIGNIANWLNPNEAVIVGERTNTCLTDDFIEKLHTREISCLISKKKFKKNFTERVIQQFHKYDIPLIFVTDNYAWSAIIKAFQDSQFKLYNRERNDQEKFHAKVITSFNKSELGVATMFQKDTGASLAIVDPAGNLISASADTDWTLIIQKLNEHNFISENGINKQMYLQHIAELPSRKDVWINPLFYKQHLIYYVLLILPKETDRISKSIATKLKILTKIIIEKTELQQDLLSEHLLRLNELFQNLRNDNFENPEGLAALQYLSGNRLGNELRVIVLSNNISRKSIWDDNAIKIQAAINHTISQQFTGITAYSNKSWFIITDATKSVLMAQLPKLLKNLDQSYSKYRFQAGVSQQYRANNLNRCFKEAVGALQYLKNNHFRSDIKHYSELGIDQLFLDDDYQLNEYYVNNMIRTFIQPLHQHDIKFHSELLKTLDCYINNDFSLTKTSAELFIHKNTLRNRINKIKELIGSNHDDFWLNLQISYRLYQQGLGETALISRINIK
ncbi:helix-turn-helix domain-containing protein [Levilactobacillus enshiensis]|uniref:helix-turn-helix domain-containing protein n=1 Tax=Levilactobacillus enshiensis TaxID=2590213 RepID=UPI00117BA6C4|nr:helix-turn-helix domain-containing protein [Levilactobacillus enshiensis]